MENDEQNLKDDLDEAPTKGEYFYEHRFPEVDELVMARVNRCARSSGCHAECQSQLNRE